MKYLFLIIFCLSATFVQAQESQPRRKLVVADIETRVPMRGVIVSTQDGYRDTTNWRGICYVPASFDTLTVYKTNYIPERLVQKELKDSTYLIPSGKAINEVTVWGKQNVQDNVNGWVKSIEAPLPGSGSGIVVEFDVAKMLDRRARRDQKHLRNVRKKFNEMEQSEDPIVRAYNDALAAQQEKEKKEEAQKKE